MDVLDQVTAAVDDYNNAYNRSRVPRWINIDQLANWLTNKSDQFDHVDVYSFLSKALGFISFYGTPEIHQGLCIVAADTICKEGGRYNEFFIGRIPYEWILDNNRDDTFEGVISDTREQIAKMTHDIMQHYFKVDLSQRKLTWVTNKNQFGSLITAHFGSDGYLPNSSHPNPEWKNTKQYRHRLEVISPSARRSYR